MDTNEAIDALVDFVREGASANDLLEENIREDSPELLEAAEEACGSWQRLLAEAVLSLARGAAGRRERAPAAPREAGPRPPRITSPDANQPMIVLTSDGQLFQIALDALHVTSTPQWQPMPQGPDAGPPVRIVPAATDASMALFTDRGNGVRLDLRLVPEWGPDAIIRPHTYRFAKLHPEEGMAFALPLRDIRDEARLHFLTRGGQIKISDSSEYRQLDSEPVTGVILRDDELLSIFPGPLRRLHVFAASSAGKAIHFDTTDVRSQGKKAGGVRAIALDEDATVVGAFPTHDVQEVALLTAQGFAKRMSIDEFRPQGRAGGGLQTCRLNDGDHVVAMTPIDPAGDLLVFTDGQQFARFPAWDLPLGSRATRGDQLLPPHEHDTIIGALGVPAGEL